VQALEQVDRLSDVILLDLNLPGMDGYAVLPHLRSRRHFGVPVIVLTKNLTRTMSRAQDGRR
jgi:CheY-like chemotaxis protein